MGGVLPAPPFLAYLVNSIIHLLKTVNVGEEVFFQFLTTLHLWKELEPKSEGIIYNGPQGRCSSLFRKINPFGLMPASTELFNLLPFMLESV